MDWISAQGQDNLPPDSDKLTTGDIMNCEEKLTDFCLVCFSKVDRSKLSKQNSLFSKNLNVVFLLKNLLQVPTDQLLGNFKKCGSPAFWISLCENCSQLTGQAMERHLQILSLVNQLRSVLKIITDKMKDTPFPPETPAPYQEDNKNDKKKSMQEKRFEILKRTKEFVANYDYNTHLVNPFIEGDKLARELDKEEDDCSSSDDSKEEEQKDKVYPNYLKVDGKFKCRYCDKLLSRKDRLLDHEMGKHPKVPGQFKYKTCGKGLNSRYQLNEHIRTTHSKRIMPGNSEEEDKETGSQKKMAHLEVDGKLKCRYCDKTFFGKWSVFTHENEKHPEISGQFKCDICGVAKNSRYGLLFHRRKIHKISVTGKPVKPRDYKREKRNMKRKGPATCHLCGKSITTLDGLRKHLRYFHDKQFDKRCHVCGTGMWTSQCLKMHLMKKHQDDPVTLKLIEDGARIWKCEVTGCKGTFWRESGLEQHTRRVHGGNGEQEGNKRFTCTFCGKTFWYGYRLKVHEERHKLGKERPYSCDICGAKFKMNSSIKRHKIRYHSEELNT